MYFNYLKPLKYILFLSIITLIIFLYSCKQKDSNSSDKNQYASISDSTEYVGIETCKSCHSDKFDTYIKTGMGMSFDKASRGKSSAKFSDSENIHDSFRDLRYHPYWKNDSLSLLEYRLDKVDTVYKRSENISWIVGSGQHTNSHLININNYIYQAPATFYTQRNYWDLPPGFEGGYNTRFSRMIGLECISCHNAYPKMVKGSENKYTYIANGIDCERCHGPGGKHVKEKLEGKIVDVKNEIDYSIVNPAKLPVALQLDVCQRCHIQGNAVLMEGKSFMDFRPGMHLSDVMNIYMPLYKGDDHSHIMASHVERMKMSKCYSVSEEMAKSYNKKHPSITPYKNAMTCVTCHDPHVSVKVTDQSVFNAKCRSCHNILVDSIEIINPAVQATSCKLSIELRLKVGDNCIKCHMPSNNTIDIPHVTATDHWIRVPVKQNEIDKIKEFATLVCINNPDADDKSKGIAFLSYFEKFSSNPAFLDSAKKYFNDENNESIIRNFKSLVRWAFLKNDFKRVVEYTDSYSGILNELKTQSYSNDDAWTAYRIGESFSGYGNQKQSILFLQKAVDLAPFQLDFRNKLAGVQDDSGLIDDARKNYEFILKENPKYVSAYINLGYLILTSEKNVEKAEHMYNMALALDPDNIQAFLNKAGINIYLGKKKEAAKYLKEVLKRDKKNEKAKLLLKQIGHL